MMSLRSILYNSVFLISKIAGLAPFYVVPSSTSKIDNHTNKKPDNLKLAGAIVHSSRIWLAYTTALILFFAVGVPILALYVFEVKIKDKDGAEGLIQVFMNYLALAVAILVWLTIIIKNKTIVKVANKLINVDERLSAISDISGFRNSHIRFLVVIFINIIMLIIDCTLDIYSRSFTFFGTLRRIIRFVSTFLIVHYAFILNILRVKFKCLNSSFLQLAEPNENSDDKNYCGASKKIAVNSKSQMKITKVSNFIALRRIYTSLYECCQQIEENFSVIMFIVIVFERFKFLYVTCRTVLILFSSKNKFASIQLSQGIVDIISIFYPICALTMTAAKTVEETAFTGRVVQKLLTKMLLDGEVIDELKSFAIELFDKKVIFTACGIFILDCTLLLSTIDVTMTDLIVIIQFNLKQAMASANSNSNKNNISD